MDLTDSVQLLERYSAVILPILVIAEQVGIPLPAVPALLAVGVLVAKFLPGLTTVMPPLAGIFGIPRLRFAIYDVAGVVLWVALWAGTGYVFSDTIEMVARRVSALGRMASLVVVGTLVGYVLLKGLRRRLFLRRLRIARISPEDLKRKLEAGEDVAILDLRTALDVAATPYAIPDSRWIAVEALDEHLSDIPRDRELVLYCS